MTHEVQAVHTKVPAEETIMAAAPRSAQWFTAADGTRHPLIEISSDSSDDEVAAGGLCGTLAPLDPAAAQAGDASEDDEGQEQLAVAGAKNYEFIFSLYKENSRMTDFVQRVWVRRVRKP